MPLSLLLAALVVLALALAAHHLAQHDHTVAIHECHTGQALAVLEGVTDEWPGYVRVPYEPVVLYPSYW